MFKIINYGIPNLNHKDRPMRIAKIKHDKVSDKMRRHWGFEVTEETSRKLLKCIAIWKIV